MTDCPIGEIYAISNEIAALHRKAAELKLDEIEHFLGAAEIAATDLLHTQVSQTSESRH